MSAPTPKEIRECYSDYRSEWSVTRDEAAADMRAISPSGPWTAEDRAQREDAGRPCIHLDQINQFLNQYCGNLRKNKRAVQLTPKGNGANDADAAKRSGVIQGIEERSNAPSSVYIPAAESAAMRSYGFAVIRTEYKDDSSFDQEILIKPILNPDTVLLNPNYKQPDASDVSDGFLLDMLAKAEFKRRFPKAEITDFSRDEGPGISDWIKEKYVQLGEFWRVEHTYSKLLLVETEKGPIIFTEAEWKEAKEIVKGTVKRERQIATPKVVQYLTNGLEILDEVPWAGTRIPIISCFGPERWVTEGGQAKRQLLSMVRFARDPQMLYDFLATQECEEAGMVPKVPFVGAKGQFESDGDVWEEINKVPHAYVQYDAMTDATGQNPIPAPTRPQWQPNFQAYELAKDSAARALQASMGITPLPDAAQRRNQKSGVALEKIDSMESLGSFHFVDRFENGFMHNMGWQINELITPVLDTQREMPVAKPDGSRATRVLVGNTSHPIDDRGAYEVHGLDEDHLHTGKGEFDVTIATGPDDASQRTEQDEFVDQLIENVANLPQPGTPQAKILALGIRMRPTLGPIGKQIAEIFDPPPVDNMPPQAQAAVQQLQSQLQALTQENSALHMERAGKVLELQAKQNIESMKGQHQLDKSTMDFITQIVKAELAAKSKADATQAQSDAQKELGVLGFSHEAASQTMEHMHDHVMADKNAANAQELAAQQTAQDAQSQNPQPQGQ